LLIVTVAAVALFLFASGVAQERAEEPSKTMIAVGPQYDATHAYVDPASFDKFVASLVARKPRLSVAGRGGYIHP
jgi:hypothetical protein